MMRLLLILLCVASALSYDCTGKANPCQNCHRRKDRLYYYCDGGAKAAKRKCNSGYKCVKTGKCQTKCEKVIKATTTTTTTTTTTVRQLDIGPTGDKDEGCGPPKCLYQKNEIPGGLDVSETPMLVYMSFDDAITPSTFSMYQILFLNAATQAKNPNGCPHRATFFVSNQYTKYEDVQTLYNANHEIASHSVNHITMKSILKEKQRSEMAGQRDVIMEKTGIPAHDIRGVRSPYLAIGGDRFYDMLEEEHFQYDASMTSISQNPIWPHTMHYGSTGYCNSASQECPQSGHSLWQVPLNAYWHRSQLQCAMLDGCRPKDANETFDFIWENFQRHYNSPERPPFGLNLHATWFIGWHHTLVGFRMFLEKIQEMDDVWVAPICEIINWIKTPVGLSNLTTSHHFQC